jgi:uncharacterized protein DUF4262
MALPVRKADEPGLGDADRDLIGVVARHGTAVMKVSSPEGMPEWAYTIGLHHHFAHPEVVVFGLAGERAQRLLNDVRDRVRAGARFEAGTETDLLLEGLPCAFREVLADWHHPFLGRMDWFYRGQYAPTVQLFWPDRERRFPWDPRFDRRFEFTQPLLYLDHPRPARAIPLLESLELWPPRPARA